MNKSDSDKNIGEPSQTNSKEMEIYNQPILWPSLKQVDGSQFELRQQLLDEFIDLQLHPLENMTANYGQKEDCEGENTTDCSGRPKRRTLDKMRTWQVVMKIPKSNKSRSNSDDSCSDPQQVDEPESPTSPISSSDDQMQTPEKTSNKFSSNTKEINPDDDTTSQQANSKMSSSEKLSAQVEQNVSDFEKSKSKFWTSKKSQSGKCKHQQTESSSDEGEDSRFCHAGQTFYLRIIFSDNHPKTKPQLGFSRKQSSMYEARDFCCFQKYINMSNYEWKKFANKCMSENENGQTGLIRPFLKDIYKQLNECTYED